MSDYSQQLDQNTAAIQAQTKAIEAHTVALKENTIATNKLIELERARDSILAEQNALIAICAKLIIASMDDTSPSSAIREVITSLSNFGYKSEYLEHFFER